MLVTLATTQTIAANSSATYTYSPDSVQKVFLNLQDADWEDASVTIQIGSRTICNGAQVWGLLGLSSMQSGVGSDTGSANGFLVLDFGSHQCTNADNLYVTINAVGELTAIDVSALVDEPGQNFPVKITEYSDSTFTSENNLVAISYASDEGDVDGDSANCEIRTSISSSAPSFISASSYFKANTVVNKNTNSYGFLNRHRVPLKTTYNYTSSVTDRIITVEQMPTTRAQQQQATRSAKVARAQAGR